MYSVGPDRASAPTLPLAGEHFDPHVTFGFHPVAWPAGAAIARGGCRPIESDVPAAYAVAPETASARSSGLMPPVLAGFGFHAVRDPSRPSAASLLRGWPLRELKVPPAYTVDPDTAIARAPPLGFGFQLVNEPVFASIALRPTYTVEPETASGPA